MISRPSTDVHERRYADAVHQIVMVIVIHAPLKQFHQNHHGVDWDALVRQI
jgi:hypothetical protein